VARGRSSGNVTWAALALLCAAGQATAGTLLDLVNPPGLNPTPYALTFTASGSTTDISFAGYQAPFRLFVNGISLTSGGANLLGATWTFTPYDPADTSDAGQSADKYGTGTNGLFFADGVGRLDRFDQVVPTVAGKTYTLNFQFSNYPFGAGPGNAPSELVVSASNATPESASVILIPGGGGAAQVTLPGGTVSTPYSQTLPASDGNPPYSWTMLGGALPPGLSLSGDGTLSGTPAQAGTFEFSGKVTDTSGASASSMFLVTIAPKGLTFTTASTLPNGIAGSDYPAQVFTATGGNAPYTFQTTSVLPGGLTFSGGAISGIPTTAGAFSFIVAATDSSSPALTASAPFKLTVQPARPDLILSQASLVFSLKLGATGVPSGASVSVRSSVATQPLNYSVAVTPAVPWLDVTGGGTTPGTIGATLDLKALLLGGGISNTSIVVTCIAPSPCAGNSQSIGVSLNVSSAPPQLSLTDSLLSFSTQTSNPQPISRAVGLRNVGGGAITVNSIATTDNFVSISGTPATVAGGPFNYFTVTVNPANLTAGYYQSAILVNTSAGLANVPVTLLISPNPIMTLNPSGTRFQQAAGSSPGNPNGSFLVDVSGSSTVYWNATLLPGASWLTLNTASGTSTSANPGAVSFSVNPALAASLTAPTYYGAIQVTSSDVADSPQTFIVILNVSPATSPSLANPTPAGLVFIYNGTAAPAEQDIHVYASSQTQVGYQASSDSTWLQVVPTIGSTSTASPGTGHVTVSPSGLASGVYRGNVSYALSSAAVPGIGVTLIVEPGVAAADRTTSAGAIPRATTCAPTQLVPTQTGLLNNFAEPAAFPTPLTVLLVDNCGNPTASGQVVATFSNGDPPLALNATDASSGTYSGTWTPRNTTSQVVITVRATAAGLPAATVQTLGQVTPSAAPLLTQNGTLNAFAIAPEPGVPIAPGTIVQIYGANLAGQTTSASTIPLPGSINQTSVIIGGLMAPLYFVSPGQINAQVPFELAAGNPYQVIVSANGALSTPNAIQLTSDAPGIAQFAAGQAIAQHLSDNSLITETSPAKPGENIVFYVAGMGLTNPGVASGIASPSTNLPALLDAATLTLNGAPIPPANILFAGLTPTLVGLYQIDFQVPANAPNGDLPLVLTQTSGVSNSTILPVHN